MDGVRAPAPAFRYADVGAEHRDWLRGRAEHINMLGYKTVCTLVETGRVLAEVSTRLKKSRTFRRWVAAELPFSRAWAYHLIRIAEAFGPHVRPDAAEVIETKALVILSAAPPGARAYALELARDGTRVTAAAAREIVAAHRPAPDPDREAVRGHEANMRSIREAERRDRAAAAPPADDLVRKARLADMILALAGLRGVVTITTVDDEEDDGEAPFHVSALLPTGRRAATRRALADAVAAVLEAEETRRCLGPCGREKPLGEFGENRLKRGGKNPYCKACERVRLGSLKRAAKAEARRKREEQRDAS